MLSGQSIVYFAPEGWEGLWRNRQQLMSVLARQNRVLFVEARRHLKPTIAGFRSGELGLNDLRRQTLLPVADDLFVFRYPVWAPLSGRSPIKQLGQIARRRALRQALNRLDMRQPIVWYARPEMVDVLDEVPSPRLRVYHVVDDYATYSGHSSFDRERVEALEREMMARVDIAIVVSRTLLEAKRRLNPRTYLVPNGVNYAAYTAALADPRLPEDLQAIKSPRLGYIGLIGDKLDFAVLEELARSHPDWSLILIGQVRVCRQAEAWQRLRALPNVHHLGPVEVVRVPHYVKGFQVGLMPYQQNRHSEAVDPLKLYDYLAAGLPVVSTDIPAARESRPHVLLAGDPSGFVRAVQDALADSDPESRRLRQSLAAQRTWEVRAEQISELLRAEMGRHRPSADVSGARVA